MSIWDYTANFPYSPFLRWIQFVCDEWMMENDMISTDPRAGGNSAIMNSSRKWYYLWQMFIAFYYTTITSWFLRLIFLPPKFECKVVVETEGAHMGSSLWMLLIGWWLVYVLTTLIFIPQNRFQTWFSRHPSPLGQMSRARKPLASFLLRDLIWYALYMSLLCR